MDQDVEAILNAPDSDDDDGLNVQGVSLEDILREDDGGYHDEDDLVVGHRGDEENPPHLLGSDVSPSRELERWGGDGGGGRGAGTSANLPSGASRGSATAAAAAGGLLSPRSFGGEDTSTKGGWEAGSVGYSNPYSGGGGSSTYGDGDNGSLSGAPPRTAFLSRDEVSEDSRLLQQILRESEEEIAASAADRANGFGGAGGGGSGGGGGAMTRLVSSVGGAGTDLYGAADDNLQSLDVDKIIESMELEAGEHDDVTGRAGRGGSGMTPWRASAAGAGVSTTATAWSGRRRSSTADVIGGGGEGDGGAAASGRRSNHGRSSSATGTTLPGSGGANDANEFGSTRGSATAAKGQNGGPVPRAREKASPGGSRASRGSLLSGVAGDA
ncbi:unnamed protein product, partial [Ectocarpus sp. 12 AP-2014]